MQIQRLQNFYLLIALILQGASLAMPWWNAGEQSLTPVADPVLMIIGVLAAVMSLIGICLFKNLRRQKLVAAIAALVGLLAVSYAYALTFMDGQTDVTIATGAIPMAIGAIFDILARNRVVHDEKLLRSADRLR